MNATEKLSELKEAVEGLDDGRARIEIVGGQRPQAIEAAFELLRERAASIDLYSHGGVLVQPFLAPREGFTDLNGQPELTEALSLEQISLTNLQLKLDQLAVFIAFRAVRGGGVRPVVVDCPENIAKSIYTASSRLSELPQIERIAEVPLFDGQLLTAEPGLHRATWITAPRGVALPKKLTRAAAEAALGRVRVWLAEFPFENATAEAVAVALLMTAALRPSLSSAPGFLIRKPSFGAGATMLARMGGVVATGRTPPVMNYSRLEEGRKHVAGALIACVPLLVLDNLPDGAAFSDSLVAQILSEPLVQVRELGSRRLVDCDTRRLVIATGVNIMPDADLVRRMLVCALDPKLERPEERRFQRPNLIAELQRARAAVLSDLFTITATYLAHEERAIVNELAGFDQFRHWVAEPLRWLGLPDALATSREAAVQDVVSGYLTELLPLLYQLHRLKEHRNKNGLATRDLTEEELGGSALYVQVQNVLGQATNARMFDDKYQLDAVRVGYFLRKVTKRVVTTEDRCGAKHLLRLVQAGRKHGQPIWAVEVVSDGRPAWTTDAEEPA